MALLLFPPALAGLIILLFRKKKLSLTLTLFLLLLDAAGGALLLSERAEKGDRNLTAVVRTDREQAIPLETELSDGQALKITLRVPALEPDAGEASGMLDEAYVWLDSVVLKDNVSWQEVRTDLLLPSEAMEEQVSISWETDHPEYLSAFGMLMAEIPEDGAEVNLTGHLTCKDLSRVYKRELKVFPSEETGSLAARLQARAEALNEHSAEAVYHLPATYGDRQVTWRKPKEQRGALLLGLTLVITLLLLLSGKKRREEEVQKWKDRLEMAYPDLISKLLIMLCAGLTPRTIIQRLSKGSDSPLARELARVSHEMDSGVSEWEAYEHLAERVDLPSYRGLSILLIQNLKKGGGNLPLLLEQEALEAFESRKRAARVRGEKASIRLLLPMGLMLLIVLALVLVPAMVSL